MVVDEGLHSNVQDDTGRMKSWETTGNKDGHTLPTHEEGKEGGGTRNDPVYLNLNTHSLIGGNTVS